MEYFIREFSKLTGLGIHTLRYYEQDGLITPERNSSKMRKSSFTVNLHHALPAG